MTQMNKYRIGQVIFAVLSKKNHVYPMQVVEIITKKTMKGEEIHYLLQGGPSNTATVMLDEIDGEIFETAEIARNELIARATNQVNKLINSAAQKAIEWYGESVLPSSIEDLPDFNSKKSITVEDTITLEDGTVAKIRLPAALTG